VRAAAAVALGVVEETDSLLDFARAYGFEELAREKLEV
jgi:hypothetical protein